MNELRMPPSARTAPTIVRRPWPRRITPASAPGDTRFQNIHSSRAARAKGRGWSGSAPRLSDSRPRSPCARRVRRHVATGRPRAQPEARGQHEAGTPSCPPAARHPMCCGSDVLEPPAVLQPAPATDRRQSCTRSTLEFRSAAVCGLRSRPRRLVGSASLRRNRDRRAATSG